MAGLLARSAVAVLCAAASAAAAEETNLKVTRVAMFSSGVAFFEREASVTGTASAVLRFRTDQINDILKSLVVQDLGGGRAGVVSYASKDPLERTLKSFAVDLTGEATLASLLEQLRGQRVEVVGPRNLAGTIVSVEQRQIPGGESREPMPVHYLNLLTAAGLQQLRIDQLQGVKLADARMESELQQALAALAGGRDTDKKAVTLRFEGQGERKVRASFLLESPIWKTTYRLVLSGDRKPFLQGWAAVENATDEDWENVGLSLVSGRPISFQMDLYTPIYIPRPQEDLELYASLRAPEFAAGFFGGFGGGGAMRGEGAALPRASEPANKPTALGRRARGATAAPAQDAMRLGLDESSLDSLGESVRSVASAREAGELFEYTIQAPVSIDRQNSAMLPIINQEVAAEKLSIYTASAHPRHPLHALMLENSTGLHLMQGPVTLFDGDTYAGDAKLPDVKAGEKRLVAYALDLGMEVMSEGKPVPVRTVSFRIGRGTLTHKIRQTDERTYTARNKDRKDRVLLIEQGYAPGWELAEPKEPFERTDKVLRFRTAVPAGKTVSQTVRLENVVEQAVALSEVGLDAIAQYLRSSEISPAVADAIRRVAAMRTELDEAVRQRAEREKRAAEAVQEQGRIRENLKTIQQGTDSYQRQLKKFDELETQIEKLRSEVEALRQAEEQKRRALADFLASLEVG